MAGLVYQIRQVILFLETIQPHGSPFEGYNDPVNGTMFIALTDFDLFGMPYTLSFLTPHLVAGPSIYQSD